MAVESGAIFVEIAAEYIVEGAVKFADQIVDAKPQSAGEDAPILQVSPEDVNDNHDQFENELAIIDETWAADASATSMALVGCTTSTFSPIAPQHQRVYDI